MKLSRARVSHMTESLVSRLQEEGYAEVVGEKQALIDALGRTITDDLQVEDRLNAEVRELMKRYAAEIERGQVDYQKMFTMIKNKLVKERGLIL
ncbi:MAG: DUF507 family protein [Nitrospiraceae bacterium]